MLNKNKSLDTAEDLRGLLDQANLNTVRRRDLKSAVSRVCVMAGCAPRSLRLDVPILRETLGRIRPAAHGVSWKTWGNIQSLFRRALELAGVVDRMDRGVALRHPLRGPLMCSIAHDKRLAGGLAAFANWCAAQDRSPDEINDAVLQEFHVWLETRTLCPKPRDLVRRIPHVWNEAPVGLSSSWPFCPSSLHAGTFTGRTYMKASRPTRNPIWRCGLTLTCSTSGLTHQDGLLPKAP